MVAVDEDDLRLQTESITDVQVLPISWAATGITETLALAIFSPDGHWFAASSYSGILGIWDVAADKPLSHSKSPLGYPLAFSPDGRLLVTTSEDGLLRLIDPRTGRVVKELIGHPGPVWSAAFSQNGKGLVTSGSEDDPRVWDVSTGKQQIALVGHSGTVVSAVFSPDSERVATASLDDTARIWPVTIDDLVRIARSRVQRLQPELTPEERKTYRLDQTSP